MHDNDPSILEREKKRTLSGEQVEHIDSAPGWNQHLATTSEAGVKADRHPYKGSVQDLQKETAKKHQDAHRKRDAWTWAPSGRVVRLTDSLR